MQSELSDQWLADYNIMVVDDNAINLNLMKLLLGNYDARVHTVSDGEDEPAGSHHNGYSVVI